MTGSTQRMQRVADLIRKELAHILLVDSDDPRFREITITSIDVSPNLSHAKVYVTMLDETASDATMKSLVKAAKYLRHKLAHAVSLRSTPALHFVYDRSVAEGARISALIKAVPMSSETPEDQNEEDPS